MLFTILLNVISDGKISLYVSDMFCLKFVSSDGYRFLKLMGRESRQER